MSNGNALSKDEQSVNSDSDSTDFDRLLIAMVREASTIWDRNSNTYPNPSKQNQLWEQIGSSLHRDINTCRLRWKALREKYIRQKVKYQEGKSKWELLDDLSFLDKVIQYRRKQSEIYTDSSNDFLTIVKEKNAVRQMADVSFPSPNDNEGFRPNSVSSYGGENEPKASADSEDNRPKDKTPEQTFGDLVASLLTKKPENERILYMTEIMTVLSK